MYNCLALHNATTNYNSISDSPFTANFTCSGAVHDNTRFRANKYFLTAEGNMYFNGVSWAKGGAFYVMMPFNTPASISTPKTEYNILFSLGGTFVTACIDVYQDYLAFRVYSVGAWGK